MRSIFISVTKAPNFLKDSCILSFVSFRLVHNLGKSRAAHVYGGIYHQRCVISRIFIQLMRLMAISYIYIVANFKEKLALQKNSKGHLAGKETSYSSNH